jgi:class 3 adenylate cyclase
VTDSPELRKAYLAALCRNVPYHIVERVLADPSPAAIELQEFEGSVLQVDLVGFTSLCEELASSGGDALSRLAEVLSEFFESLLEDAFFPYEGFVVQFGGDSTTVVFREENHAVRAAAAALRAQEVMRDAPLARKSDSLRLRVAIASGNTRLHVLGEQSHRVVVCGGEASRLAMDLQRKANPGIVVLDDTTVEFLGAHLGDGDVMTSDLLRLEGVGYELRTLRDPPERKPIVELGDRIDDLIEEKIELLEPFVPAPISARLRAMPDDWRIEGELRNIVVVYAEAIGWTIDNVDLAHEASQLYLSLHRKFGGLVTRTDLTLGGHRSLSLFGLHAPTENDSERAVMAALEASALVKNLVEQRAPGVTIRIGIHTGPVFFGAIGSRYRYDISVVGDVVHTAARVAAQTGQFQVTVTNDVLSELRSEFSTSESGSILIRNASEPLSTHVVHGVTGGRARYVQRRSERRRFRRLDCRRGPRLDWSLSVHHANSATRSGQVDAAQLLGTDRRRNRRGEATGLQYGASRLRVSRGV